jgi:aminoglycoside 6'-N-acetyltransferase I
VTIREAVPEDLVAINLLHASAGRSPWTAEVLDDFDRFVVVAERNGLLIGAAKTHFFPGPDGPAPAGHYLGGITVHPDHRGLGIGTALSRARMAWVWERTDVLHSFTDDDNVASIRLHATLGFEEMHRAPTIRGAQADRDGGSLILFRARRPR